MARANRRRLFRLPRRADQQPGAERVSIPRPRSLASAAMSAQPKSKSAMDAHDETGRRVPPPAASPASLAECALRRQTPEVGAECPNWARSELSGGRSETSVPTGNRCLMVASRPKTEPALVGGASGVLTRALHLLRPNPAP